MLERAKIFLVGKKSASWAELARELEVDRNTLRRAFIRDFGILNPNELLEPEFDEGQEVKEVEYGDDYIKIVCASKRIKSQEDAIQEFGIDTSLWRVDKCKVKTSEGYRKDRSVKWTVRDGKVVNGDVEDSGKMLVVPLYHVELRLVRKTDEYRARLAIKDFIEDAKKHAPKYPVKHSRKYNGLTYEIDIPDIHIGKEAILSESGANYGVDIAKVVVNSAMSDLLNRVEGKKIEKILLPLGNDYFNVDNKQNTTSHGTPQQEDKRWSDTFREGRRLATQMIDACLSVAPVDVVVIAGNHDEQRTFYLGEVLDAQYSKTKYVTIDTAEIKRKYRGFGKNLIGFTHGYWEKPSKLPALMAYEQPQLWARSLFREFHLGDKHHKKDLEQRTEDMDGVVVRWLRSLCPSDTWLFDKGYNMAPRAAEAFLYDNDYGQIESYIFRSLE